ncbi:MAG TPA: superoxide dismutase [Mycobacteriales bacterium]|nr:superoxide dismutase [Mycobacteriales bacterium]
MAVVRRLVIAVVAGLALLPAGPARAAGPAAGVVVRVAQFQPWDAARPPAAVTYDEGLVPAGGLVVVAALTGRGGTLVLLSVAGLVPHHQYGAHVHRSPCGETPAASGAHYQNVPDPVQPSVDPRYANPANEVWLDVSTDAGGAGRAIARVRWTARPGQANSVVLHAHGTSHEPGGAGTAGARVGCLTVPF